MAVSDRLTSIKADVIITYGSKSWIKQQNNPKIPYIHHPYNTNVA